MTRSQRIASHGATVVGAGLAGPAAAQATSNADADGSDTARVRSVIQPGTVLRAGAIRRSPNGKFQLQMQRDGNFVLYRRSTQKALWATDTSHWRRSAAAMQRDGLVLESGDDSDGGLPA